MNDDTFDTLAATSSQLTAKKLQELYANLMTFSQLYVMVRLMKLKGKESAIICHIKMMDTLAQEVFVNSKILVDTLVEEFNRIGQLLTSGGVDLSEYIEQLELNINQAVAGQGGTPVQTH